MLLHGDGGANLWTKGLLLTYPFLHINIKISINYVSTSHNLHKGEACFADSFFSFAKINNNLYLNLIIIEEYINVIQKT